MQKKSCVLVTGAATGIGRAITQMFADRGWFVAVADIDEAGVQQVAQMLGAECAVAFGIRVVDVIPLFVNTSMVKDLDANAVQSMSTELIL